MSQVSRVRCSLAIWAFFGSAVAAQVHEGHSHGPPASAQGPVASSATTICSHELEAVPWTQVTPGIWVWAPAQSQDVSVHNRGFVIPVSALVDGTQAWVVDPGPSFAQGLRVKASLQCRLGVEVVGVFNTHAHAENVLANAAFDVGTPIFALEGTHAAMQERCPQCLQSLVNRVGEQEMEGTHVVWPNRILRAGDVLLLGSHRLEVLPPEQGHTEADLLLWHPQQRWLWAGGLVYAQRVPELAQGSLDQWLKALDAVMQLKPRGVISTVVSGAEEAREPLPAVASTRLYLRTLRDKAWQAMDRGLSPLDLGWADMPEFSQWEGYTQRHGFNAQRAWRELEPQWMQHVPGASATADAQPESSQKPQPVR